jgi:hypothetical protein
LRNSTSRVAEAGSYPTEAKFEDETRTRSMISPLSV